MKAQVVISLFVGIVAGGFGGTIIGPEGDPRNATVEFDRSLASAFDVRPVLSTSPPPGVSLKTFAVSAPDGQVLEIQLDTTPTKEDLEAIFAQVNAGGAGTAPRGMAGRLGKVVQKAPRWANLEPMWASFTWSNQQVAEAKALLRFSAKPDEAGGSAWERRLPVSFQPWQIEERGRLWARRSGAAIAGLVGGFLLALGTLASVAWAWRFLLARIREVSDAVRGR